MSLNNSLISKLRESSLIVMSARSESIWTMEVAMVLAVMMGGCSEVNGCDGKV